MELRLQRLRILTVFFPLIFFLSCDNKVLRRAVDDYYPIEVGASWLYKSDTLEIYVTVDAETTWANQEAALFLINGEPLYRSKLSDGVYYYFDFRVPYGGYDYPIETQYRRWLTLPLITNSNWGDVFKDSIVVAGEKVSIEHRITGRVLDVVKSNVPAGEYKDVYRVEILNVCRISSSLYYRFDSTLINEYYAPDIGLISIDSSSKKFNLQEYQGL